MDATKEQLAKALAEAVKHEAELSDYLDMPPWFQDAVEALAAYSAEQDLEKNKVHY